MSGAGFLSITSNFRREARHFGARIGARRVAGSSRTRSTVENASCDGQICPFSRDGPLDDMIWGAGRWGTHTLPTVLVYLTSLQKNPAGQCIPLPSYLESLYRDDKRYSVRAAGCFPLPSVIQTLFFLPWLDKSAIYWTNHYFPEYPENRVACFPLFPILRPRHIPTITTKYDFTPTSVGKQNHSTTSEKDKSPCQEYSQSKSSSTM